LLDITLLRIMKYRTDYQKLIHAVPLPPLDETTRVLIKDFGKYFAKYPEHQKIDVTVLLPIIIWKSTAPCLPVLLSLSILSVGYIRPSPSALICEVHSPTQSYLTLRDHPHLYISSNCRSVLASPPKPLIWSIIS